MAALIKEKDTCSNALVDLWCVIDFMEKVGVRKLGLDGANRAKRDDLEGFILLLFLGSLRHC